MRRASGRLFVYTFKEGALSAVAHDLRISLQPFEVALDGSLVEACINLSGLRVDGPVRAGVLEGEGYDAEQAARVERAMHGEVLRTQRFPTARFAGRAVSVGDGFSVTGELSLCGRSQPVSFEVERGARVGVTGQWFARFEIVPSRWGIAPYKALLGAIRVQDRVLIEFEVREDTATS